MPENDTTLTCPACGEPFSPADASIQQCPSCGEQFFVDAEELETDEDREARDAVERRRMQERDRLDNRRIRVVQLEKRSLYRSRSWMLVLAMGLVGIAGQLVWLGIRHLVGTSASEDSAAVAPDIARAIAYFVIAVGLVAMGVRFYARARRYLREARAMTLPEPATPPDFSTLNDGSQIVDNLRAMSHEDDDPRP